VTKPRWSVRKKGDQWRVYDRQWWHDTFDTLEEAHTYAMQCAVADVLYEPGGLTRLAELTAAKPRKGKKKKHGH
jgi:hypothetical protein